MALKEFLARHPEGVFGFLCGFLFTLSWMALLARFQEWVEGGAGKRKQMVAEYKRQAEFWKNKWMADFEKQEIG